jgi:hypothetical protein
MPPTGGPFTLTTCFSMQPNSSPSIPPASHTLPGLALANRVDRAQAFGLVALRADLAPDIAPPESVELAAAGHRAVFRAAEVGRQDGAGNWGLMVHVLTHLLPDGPTEVSLVARWPDGTTLPFGPIELQVRNPGRLAAEVRADLLAFGTPALLPRVIDSALFPYQGGRSSAWFDTALPREVPLSFEQPATLHDAHRHLERWGFCILPERLPAALIQSFREQLDHAIETRQLAYERGSSQRIHHAHRLPAGRDIWLYPPVLEFLNAHFQDTPCACQTLTYVNGSEQGGHQDTIHLTPYPAGFMCGVWIALEDVVPDSGELFVFPGSHKTTRLRAAALGLEKVDTDYSSYVKFDTEIRRLVEEGGFSKAVYRPKAGQILVWHENLIHGGSPRADRSRTRLSIVSHYFAKGSVAYYDSRGEAAALEVLPGVA